MKKGFLLFLLCAFVFMASAEHVGREKAMFVAKAFIANKFNQPLHKGSDNDIVLKEVAQTLNFNNFYIFNYENGFVIVSADDRVNPVLAYSHEAPFNVDGTPSNIIEWLRGYENEIKDVIDRDFKSSPEIKREWDCLLEGKLPEAKSRGAVEPLIQTHWDQMEPYNTLCPIYGVDQYDNIYRTPTGCVATAMAQVMKYYEHPNKGTGSHAYNHYSFGNQSADFGNATYDWDNMPNVLTESSSVEEIVAVATLMYHCGVSVEMDYGEDGSGANSGDVPTALKNYFSYPSTAKLEYKSGYTVSGEFLEQYSDSEWINLLKTELNASRPLYYSGSNLQDGMGHAFVCDGYDENDCFHFNWGWSGSCDGYYQIGALNPGPGGTGSGVNGTYNDYNAVIINCQPNSSIAAPTNLLASVDDKDVSLQWSSVSEAASYKVYRDGIKITSVTSNSYTDNDVAYGSHSYYVKSVASDGNTSQRSNTVDAEIVYPGPAPTDLEASVSGSDVSLTWDAPTPRTASLNYGKIEDSESAVGLGCDIYWGQRYPKDKLVNYAGMAVNRFNVLLLEPGLYTFFLYKGDELGVKEKIYEKSITATSTNIETVDIDPIMLDYTSDLWVVMYAPASIEYPIVYCSYSESDAVDACYLSADGFSWTDYSQQLGSWAMELSVTDGTFTYNLYRNDTKIADNLSEKSYNDSGLSAGTYKYFVKTNYYGGESAASDTASVTIKIKEYITGEVNVENLEIVNPTVIEENAILTVTGNFVNTDPANLIIEDGGQLIHNNEGVKATAKKTVTPYGGKGTPGWHFLAAPMEDFTTESFINQANGGGYDLYKWCVDENGVPMWYNYKAHTEDFETNFVLGRGYLTAYETTENCDIQGTLNYGTTFEFNSELNYNDASKRACFTLLGNPFTYNLKWSDFARTNIYNGFAVVNSTTGVIGYVVGDTPIKVGTGFMVFAEGENPTLTYERGSGDSKDDVLALNLFAGNGNGEDNTIIVLDDEEGGFVKADNLSNDVPQIYTEKLGDKYGICNFPTDTKEVPVSFKAVGEGSNTVRLETIGEFDYVHLYDRFTDVDVDMLLEGSYTFEASENDDTHRFIVIIDKGDLGIEDVNGNESFVSVRNGEIHVSGQGDVRIFDVLGRSVYSDVINGDATISTSGFKTGVYVVRIIGDGWTKAEKIAVYF